MLALPALPVAEELELLEDAVAEDEEPLEELLGEPLLSDKAPKTPPATVAGEEPWALAAADL